MRKSDLIDSLVSINKTMTAKDVESAVKEIIEHMSLTLSEGKRIEVRGFGSFSLHYRKPRVGRNPKTGKQVNIASKHVPYFKVSKELKERVNASQK